MHKTYPYKFDTTEIPFFNTWNESFGRLSNTNQSEAGGDIETVIRIGKLSVSASGTVLSDLAKTIQTFSKKDSFVLTRYDQYAEAYTTHTVRMTSFSANRVELSEYASGTTSTWDVSFKLEEF